MAERTGGGGWPALLAILLVVGGIAAVLLWRSPPAAPVDTRIGAAIAVDPAAAIATPPATSQVARVQSPVHADDRITTGPDGAIRIQFTDATFFSLGADASARIDSFVFDPGRNASKLSLAFARGAFRFVSGAAVHAYPDQPAIRTPVAVIGIRGTGVDGVIGPEAETLYRLIDPSFVPDGGDATKATLILLTAGAIDVDGSGVRTVLDVPGQVVFFRREGAPPLRPGPVSRALVARIAALAAPPSLGPEPGGSPESPTPTQSASPRTPVSTPTAVPSPLPQPSPSPIVTSSPIPTPTPSSTPGFPGRLRDGRDRFGTAPRQPDATPVPQPTPRTPRALPTFRPVTKPFVRRTPASPAPTRRPIG